MRKSLAINAILIISSFMLIIASINVFFIYIILEKTVSIILLLFFIISVSSGLIILIISSLRILKLFQNIEKEEIKINLDYLSDDEKFIINLILKNKGIMLQNKIVNESGMTKVKVSRIISSLESKGFIEKRRRGVTNEIIIKK
ncbi:MAG: helix-turn-helix transcriptional regulator [Thermoplasmata archaeon]